MPLWLPGVLVALVGVIPAVLVYQQADAARRQSAAQADRAAELEQRKADREDLQALVDIWKQSFDAVTLDNKDLRKEVGWCRRRITQLEQALRRAGVPIPNGDDAA